MILRILEGLCKRLAASIYRLGSPEWFDERQSGGLPPAILHPQEIDMSLNSFITLGRSGLRVSPLCLGSMTFGEDLGWGASVADSETMIAAYLERGGNFIDTANVYTNGHSEKIIGDFFAKKGNRDRVVI